MPETVSRKSSWPISTCLLVVSLPVVSFALISSELRHLAMLTPMARDLGVTEGASVQAEALTTLFPGIAAPTAAVVIAANLNLCVLVTMAARHRGGKAQARFWRGGFGRLQLLRSSKRNKSCS